MSADLPRYYADRAKEYDRVYAKPERQADLARLKELLAARLDGQDVLEVACGTGYWTQYYGPAARSVLATDVNEEVLAIARERCAAIPNVRFAEADAYALAGVAGESTACLAAFWWSHVPRSRLASFLAGLHTRLGPGALVMFIDNRLVPGSSTPISRTDAEGDTYQQRKLQDGRTYELKNFPDESQVLQILAADAAQIEFQMLPYYWYLAYRVR